MLADHIHFIDGEALLLDKPAGLPVDAPRARGLSVESQLES
jgi:tRNA pseudouridine32 synthase/23S rRNA pseudouridine746 synthase